MNLAPPTNLQYPITWCCGFVCRSYTFSEYLAQSASDVTILFFDRIVKNDRAGADQILSHNQILITNTQTSRKIVRWIIDTNSKTAIKYLIDTGFQFDVIEENSSLGVIKTISVLIYALQQNSHTIFRKLIKVVQNDDLQATDANTQNTCLHLLVLQKSSTSFSPFLKELRRRNLTASVINITNQLGQTALFIAAEKQDSDYVQKLLDYDADPNIRDRKRKLPIDAAESIFSCASRAYAALLQVTDREAENDDYVEGAIAVQFTNIGNTSVHQHG